MSPEEHIARIEKCVVAADIAGMAESLGELHGQWQTLPATLRSQLLKLDAILLTLLQARTRQARAPNGSVTGFTTGAPAERP